MKLLLASNNAKKRAELERILSDRSIDIVTPAELSINLEPVEDGATFEENALIKATAFARLHEGPVLADDSGLEVDALEGAPGIHSARFAGPEADDAANRELLLERLNGIAPDGRSARLVCALVLVDGGKTLATIRGECEGQILEQARGTGGFGYDSLFMPAASDKSFAELDAGEKDGFSHRGLALKRVTEDLDQIGIFS